MRRYLILLAILWFLTALMAVDGLAILTVFITLGLGFPLIFVGTAAMYITMLLPAVYFWRSGLMPRLMSVVASAFLIFGAATLPYQWEREISEATVSAVAKTDNIPMAIASKAKSLEVRRKKDRFDDFFERGKSCGPECRAVLMDGDVDWVRIVLTDGIESPNNGPRNPSYALFRAMSGKDCAVPGFDPPATHRCVLHANNIDDPADIVLSVSNRRLNKEFRQEFDPDQRIKRITDIEVKTFGRNVVAQSMVKYQLPVRPTIIGPKMSGLNSKGAQFLTSSRLSNKQTFRTILIAMGFQMGDLEDVVLQTIPRARSWKDGVDPQMTREVIAILDLPGDEPFDRAKSGIISNWTSHARSEKQWSPELIGLLRRIIRDKRMIHPSNVDQIVARKPEVAKKVLSDVFDMLEAEPANTRNLHTPARQVAWDFASMHPKLLEPFADRYRKLLNRGGKIRETLIGSVGRFGFNPLSEIAPILGADKVEKKMRRRSNRLKAACQSARQWRPVLVPELRKAAKIENDSRDGRRMRGLALKILAKFGDRSFVDQNIAWMDEKARKRFLRQIKRETERIRCSA